MRVFGRRGVLSRPFVPALALLLALVAGGIERTGAQEVTPEAAVERLFRAPAIEPGWFDAAFLAAVPVERLAAIIADLTRQFGPLQEIVTGGERLTVRLSRAEMPVSVTLDAEGRIAGLFFHPPVAIGGTVEEQVAAIAALPGEVAVLVRSDGADRAAHRPDEAMAVGSAAKLAVLLAVEGAIGAGRLSPDQVVPLDERWRSLPSGILQGWPAATPLTIATLEVLMMSLSDNTATDALIALVGRDRVEALTPRNTPFLTTAQLFRLKGPDGAALFAEWLAAGTARRAALLPQVDALPLPPALRPGFSYDVEWFMTARELCDFLEQAADRPALSVNPGLAEPADWARVAFKGGSEPGVLNFSTLVTGKDGRRHCVVATWNGQEANDAALAAPYRALLKRLAAEGEPARQ